jgi:hypothetical protein
MSGENPTTQPIDVTAIIESVTEEVTAKLVPALTESITKQVRESYAAELGEIREGLNTVANTIKDAPPADADRIKKLVGETLAAERTSAQQADAAKAARQTLIDKIKTERLGGNDRLASLLTGDDEAALNASADNIIETAKTLKPDFGSTKADGGEKPASTQNASGGGLKWAV